MANLTLHPISFNSKNNEVIIDKEIIPWRKQKATLAKKKNTSAIDYINQTYGNDINDGNGAIIFAYFDYNENSTLYLMYSANTINDKTDKTIDKNIDKTIDKTIKLKKNILKTNLYFDLYIPSLNSVEIIEDACDIETTDEKITVYGKVYGLCLDNNTYYFKNIDINEYIEFVQRNNEQNLEHELEKQDFKNPLRKYSKNNEDGSDEENDAEDDEDDEDEEDEDVEENDDEDDEEENHDEDDVEDDEDDNQDDNEDDDENEEDEDVNIDEIDIDDIDDKCNAIDGDENADADADEDDDEDEEDDEEATEAVDYEEPTCEDGIDGEDLVDLDIDNEDEPVTKSKRKKRTTKNNKLVKSINMDDLNIIFNMLKEEPIDMNSITLEKDLYIKRSQSITILKTLNLPLKTIQLIEKGIYNYSINKCILRQTIPIWENSEFVDIYVNKTKNIYLNLNTVSYVKNIYLIEKVKKNEINPYDLAFMDSYKLFPEMWSDIIDEKTKTAKMIRDSLEESATDMFSCPRCHKRKTIYCEVQTRSSDEPMTTFITCLECGKKWKKY